jgi:poly(3-hydroxybutyrate) depolymerase
MKRFLCLAFVLTMSVGAFAQPGRMPRQVILTARATSTIQYGGPTRAEGRSYNFTPVFFIYPDGKLDEAGAEALLQELDIQPLLDSEYGTAMVINPVGDKYAADADFEAFVNLFNASRGPGNLKVVGIGQGSTFVNQVIAPKAAGQIAGILSVGGKPGKAVDAAGVPAYIAGKGAAKVAKPYQAAIAAHADEPLLKVVVNPAEKASLKEVFADAWKDVLGRNYRYNNYNHTHYEGAQFGEYGSYELEPYLDCESLGIKRIIVEHPVGRGQRGQDAPKQLWYEYWPEELLENAPARSVPVMVLLHGNQNDPRTQAETSGFIQVAAEDRFFVVEMEWQGSQSFQAMGQDGVETVIYQLLAKYPQLDPARVYAEGLSAGSMTATALGIKKSHVFAAVGGHSGGLFGGMGAGPFPGFEAIWNEATQKRGAVETAYCSVFGTKDTTVPYMTPDNWKGNSYLNAWNAYEQMNGMTVVRDMDFSVDPVFGQVLRDRESVKTAKGVGIVMETGQLYKGDIPLIRLVAVMDYGHWNFMPTARVMWDFFKHYRRDPDTKKLVYSK